MQGYDAYALECDVQVGGTEQLFNLMAGRKIQQDAGQQPHVPVTLPILVGLDGRERMSKSKGNHIGVDDAADEQYGKAMSIPDGVVLDFFVLGTNVPRRELPAIEAQIAGDPMGAKKLLARTIVTEFHGPAAAAAAQARWEGTFQRGEVPADAPLARAAAGQLLIDLLLEHGLAPSRREARRLFEQGAVTVDGAVARVDAAATPATVVQIGKRRWLRVIS
jgi:tyrosyl-tRNA synthetase